MAISDAYRHRFSSTERSGPYGGTSERVHRERLYDFLYEREYEPWFCNMVKKLRSRRALKEWVLRLHTGETLSAATPDWSWDQRARLGQQYLRNLAEDYLNWYESEDEEWVAKSYRNTYDKVLQRLEIDGYLYRQGELLVPEPDVVDVEAESSLLRSLFLRLGLSGKDEAFGFLELSEEHYVAGRWSDCIGNARKFFELVLRGVAEKHAAGMPRNDSQPLVGDRPADVRSYLETGGLLEKKEREAVEKVYALLSHTGAHPYMAEKDQARLLRQVSLTLTQFVMLRLEGAMQGGDRLGDLPACE